MRQKAGIPTFRGRQSAQEPRTTLSADRLALVQRYMIDAEEAEARARSAAARAESSVSPTAAERVPPEAERGRHAAAERLARVAAIGLGAEEEGHQPARPRATQDDHARRALAKAERQAAKQAARIVAAMEKSEARERKALAKAAARREARERKALAKSSVRP